MSTDDSNAGPPGDPFIGSVLAHRYRILKKLGTGATGSVYLAEHLTFGRLDAVKLLPPGNSNDPSVIPRVLRGMRNVTSIRHPNVCTIYDVSPTQDGWLFVAMEYIAGQSLKDIMESEGVLDPARAAGIAVQIAAALQAAHDQGVIHRDLKPANVMVDQDKRGNDIVKVVDFDISKAVDALESEPQSEITRHSFVIGTPEYMSPEQLIGDPLDGRSDVYALAVIVFRMLTGFLPIRSQTTQEIMIDRLTKPPLRLSDVAPSRTFPPGLEDLIGRGLAQQRNDRIPSAAEFARELTAVFERQHPAGQPSSAAPAGASLMTPRLPMPQHSGSTADQAIPATRASEAIAPPRPGVSRRAIVTLSAVGLLAAVIAVVMFTNGPDDDGQNDVNTLVVDSPKANPDTTPLVSAPPDSTTVDPSTTTDRPVDAGPTTDQLAAELSGIREQVGPPFPSSDELRTIARKAQSIYERYERFGSSVNHDRALAAYVAGLAWVGLESVANCETWMERAVRLDPGNSGYRELLSQCRG